MTDNIALINKYRPLAFEEVVGHAALLPPLKRAIHGPTTPHGYLFTGMAGLGKTTLARIVAGELDCEVLEIDAASNSGIDAAREIVEMGNHMSLSGAGRRAFIIDECHTLSKPAWQALLKILEEPPAHLFFMLCTTELVKVPDTIIQRCYHVPLRPLKADELGDLLELVAESEGWKVLPDVMQAVLEAATGQPRKALSMLQSVHDAPSREEVRRTLNIMTAGEPLFDLCSALANGAAWGVVKPLLLKVEDADMDQAPVLLGRFLCTAMGKAESPDKAKRMWQILDALLFPAATYDRKAALYAAVGRIIWGS